MPSLPRSDDSEPGRTDTDLRLVWTEHAPAGVHALSLPGDELARHIQVGLPAVPVSLGTKLHSPRLLGMLSRCYSGQLFFLLLQRR